MGGESPVADHPRQTATFLFTDIESHTELWRTDPEATSVAVAEHDRLLAETVRGAGGEVVKYGGDAVMAVFRDAGAAVACALEGQRILDQTEWPQVGGLRVRMGIHTGWAFERAGDYYGPEVIRAARLCDAGHGQQVLASAVVVALTGADRWTDLGEHLLRGLGAPERVYQLVGPGLRKAFPPLRTAQAPRDLLPRPRTSFVGRIDDIDAIRRELQAHRLVTLTGVGGSGKTRLAIEAARTAIEDHADGAVLVDLSGVTEEDQLLPAIASTLGLPAATGASGEPVDRRLRDYLAGRHLLVVMDNCEHLLEAVAEVVDGLLEHAPDVQVLATSREPLRVEDEVIVQVGSLELDREAVALFRARAGPDGDAATVRRICERLDGIPLAIELAAARLSSLSAEELAARLDDRFRLLTGGRRRVQRQQTLQATLDWSHDLLRPEEQTLLRRLAVFAGPFRLAAVEGICGRDRGDTVEVLGALVDRSMVVHLPDAGRYRLLETVRLYAEQKLLDAGETEEQRRRHRDWFHHEVAALPLDECFFVSDTSRRLVEDLDDLRTAIRWSIHADDAQIGAELATRLTMAVSLAGTSEVVRWAEQVVPRLDLRSDAAFQCFTAGMWNGVATISPPVRSPAEAASDAGQSYMRRIAGTFSVLAELADERTDDMSVFTRAVVGRSMAGLGSTLRDGELVARARGLIEDAVELADARPPSTWTGYARGCAAEVALAEGKVDEAVPQLRRCLAEGNSLLRLAYEPLLALVLHLIGDPEAYELAMRTRQRGDLPEIVVTAAVAAALEVSDRGDHDGARAELRAALPELDRTATTVKTMLLVGGAGVAFGTDDAERAGRWLASAGSVPGNSMLPVALLLHSRFSAAASAALPQERWSKVRAEGGALALPDALHELASWLA